MARVIKGGAGANVIAAPIADARKEARRIVQQASEQAERLVIEAQEKAEAVHHEAYSEASRRASHDAKALLDEAEARRDAAVAEAQADIVRLALAVAEKLVATELDREPDRIRAILAEQLDRLKRARTIVVRIASDDADRIRDLLDERVELRLDPTLARGDIVLQSDLGDLDATLAARLRLLREALLSELR